ncbi:MAG: patatin-like phospholipase family protein [Patescibacteria group bacterium]|nr:patatin-like phospholipase family protein [Patescibacteria group bacterium]
MTEKRKHNLGKVGIIFNGGGFTGAFSVGYIKALWEQGIRPSHIQGVSVGALNAAKLLESENIKELEKIWLEIEQAKASSVFSWKEIPQNLIKKSSALFSHKGVLDIIEKFNIHKIINSPIELQIVAHNETKREKEVFSTKEERVIKNPEILKKMILASASIPGVLPMVEIDGHHYSDGIYFSLESMIKTGADTIFLFLNDQYIEKSIRWDQRLFNMKDYLYEEVVSFRIQEAIKEHPDFIIENEDLDKEDKMLPPPLKKIKKIRQQIRSVASSIATGNDINFVPHRIIIMNTRTPISTLHSTAFEAGDIKAAIEQGYDQASVLLNKLRK